MNQDRFDYEQLIKRLNEQAIEYGRTITELSMGKTRAENQQDRFMRHVHKVFGDHPNFDELLDAGWYDGWTGAGLD